VDRRVRAAVDALRTWNWLNSIRYRSSGVFSIAMSLLEPSSPMTPSMNSPSMCALPPSSIGAFSTSEVVQFRGPFAALLPGPL